MGKEELNELLEESLGVERSYAHFALKHWIRAKYWLLFGWAIDEALEHDLDIEDRGKRGRILKQLINEIRKKPEYQKMIRILKRKNRKKVWSFLFTPRTEFDRALLEENKNYEAWSALSGQLNKIEEKSEEIFWSLIGEFFSKITEIAERGFKQLRERIEKSAREFITDEKYTERELATALSTATFSAMDHKVYTSEAKERLLRHVQEIYAIYESYYKSNNALKKLNDMLEYAKKLGIENSALRQMESLIQSYSSIKEQEKQAKEKLDTLERDSYARLKQLIDTLKLDAETAEGLLLYITKEFADFMDVREKYFE